MGEEGGVGDEGEEVTEARRGESQRFVDDADDAAVVDPNLSVGRKLELDSLASRFSSAASVVFMISRPLESKDPKLSISSLWQRSSPIKAIIKDHTKKNISRPFVSRSVFGI